MYFTGTVLVALVLEPADWSELEGRLSGRVIVHGALMVVAQGGNALLRRGERPDSAIQIEHVAQAAPALAKVATDHELVLVHGNGGVRHSRREGFARRQPGQP